MADIALHDLGGEARAREIVPQAREALCARIDGGDVPSRRGELHRLADRCGAQVEDAASLAIAQKARRKAGRERSEERRVGKEWVSTGRSRGAPRHKKKK